MARDHGRILCRIWEDPEFRALSVSGQRFYMLLLSQPTLSVAGVLPITLRRWARCAGETTTADVEKALQELADARFIVVDDDTEELLIRSFIRNDGVAAQPKVLIRALRDAQAVASQLLRAALARELVRLDPKKPDTVSTGGRVFVHPDPHVVARELDPSLTWEQATPAPEPVPNPEPSPESSGNPSPNPSEETLSGTLPDTPGGRGRGRGRGSVGNGVTSVGAVADAPATDESKKPKRTPAERGTRLPEDWLPTRELVAWARERVPAVDSRHETEKFRNYFHAASGAKGVKRDWSKTWQNWMLTASERLPSTRAAAASAANDPATTGRRRVQC